VIASESKLPSPATVVSEIVWQALPEVVRLEPGQVHISCVRLEAFKSGLIQLEALLSQEEKTRASRFHFSADRNSFVIRRGIRRLLLSRILGQDPARLQFRHGINGKPELEESSVEERLYFNDSHSGGLALYGFSRDCQIGVDIEQLKPIPNLEGIAASFFSRRESRELLSLAPESREEAFIACWTRKEAVLKSTGEGIGTGLAKVEVSIDSRLEKGVVKSDRTLRDGPDWIVHSLRPAAGFLAAIAYQHSELALNSWSISPRILT
jgi:4'-phosphopantetheinyl transferase